MKDVIKSQLTAASDKVPEINTSDTEKSVYTIMMYEVWLIESVTPGVCY